METKHNSNQVQSLLEPNLQLILIMQKTSLEFCEYQTRFFSNCKSENCREKETD